jgi:UDP-2,3-diacylglucosamine hydrolase
MIIQENAIFIADSHYNDNRTILHTLLKQIVDKKIKTFQIFLMGDMFDFLAYEATYFCEINKEVITIINELSMDIQITYFEGNHDYNLQHIFPNVHVIPRDEQPINFMIDNKIFALCHGDIFTPVSYNIYSKIIRNSLLLRFLNFFDFRNWITKKIEKALKQKSICRKQDNFEEFAKERVKKFYADFVIEGHFHQGLISENYINIPSLYCSKQYMIYTNKQFKFISI